MPLPAVLLAVAAIAAGAAASGARTGPVPPSGTGSAALYTKELRAYRHQRDVVLVDQRGAGGSNPLECAVEEKTALARAAREMYPASYLQECRRHLEKNALADARGWAHARARGATGNTRPASRPVSAPKACAPVAIAPPSTPCVSGVEPASCSHPTFTASSPR